MAHLPPQALDFIAALASYADVLDSLSETIRAMKPGDAPEVIAALRALIDRVTVIDAPDGSVNCEVVGPSPPSSGAWGGAVVAEERLAQFPPIEWGRFSAL